MTATLDSIVVQRGGVSYQVDIVPDSFTHPRDFDDHRYTPADEANYGDGWQFVSVSVTPVGHHLCADFDGIEYGQSLRWQVSTADLIERADAENWFEEAHAKLITATTKNRSRWLQGIRRLVAAGRRALVSIVR